MMVDDFSIDSTLSIDEFTSNAFTHSYDVNLKNLNLQSSSTAFENIQLYNVLGQQVMNRKLYQTSETVNLGSLNDGIYIKPFNLLNNNRSNSCNLRRAARNCGSFFMTYSPIDHKPRRYLFLWNVLQ